MLKEVTETIVGDVVGGAVSGCLGPLLFYAFLIFMVVMLIKGFYRVPIGAKGVVIWMGRRTGEVRGEGVTWIPPFVGKIETLYVRERQIDVPYATYHTADRARLKFKTTVRVVVEDPAALLEQGPGTYEPFLAEAGAEEGNVALRRLLENSIREAVQSLNIHDVMFGGPGDSHLQRRILDRVSVTTRRWGLGVKELWLTEVQADDEELQRAVQSEVRESMEGRGSLAAHQAEVAKGALFAKVAGQLVSEMAASNREISFQEAMGFLQSRYRDERELEIRLKRAGNVSTLAYEWDLHTGRAGGHIVVPPSLPSGERRQLAEGSPALTLGREGHIKIDGDGVSRHHAQVEVRGDQIFISDLGSTNGTFVGGEKLPRNVPAVVTPETQVRLGNHVTFYGRELIEAVNSELGRRGP